jgi:ATP-dependent DNA helicase RecG
MKESQHAEWKETWRDEYLRWICDFANAEGGVLEIGRNDQGAVVGVPNVARLMEEIPNKVRDILGIMVEVNLHEDGGKEWIEIRVEPYPCPVSYRGEYHFRSGSTKQELKGAALDQFLLKKWGRHWDGVPLPGFQAKDCGEEALRLFADHASRSGRMDVAVLEDSREAILENLDLIEGSYLKRAACLLFSKRTQHLISGAWIKIGFFVTNDDLRYQDEIRGSLFEQVEKTLELLLTKYLKAYISYDGLQRLETYLYPYAALREALLNAVVHKDYSSGIPIQISVYEDHIVFLEPWTAAAGLDPGEVAGQASFLSVQPPAGQRVFPCRLHRVLGPGHREDRARMPRARYRRSSLRPQHVGLDADVQGQSAPPERRTGPRRRPEGRRKGRRKGRR